MNIKNSFSGSYLKYLQVLFFTVLILYFGQSLFIPLSFSLLIALILYPFCNMLEKKKWPKSLAIAFSMSLVFLLFFGIFWILIWQLNYLKNDIPFLVEKMREGLEEWLKENFDLKFDFETFWIENLTTNSGNGIGAFIQALFKNIGNFLFSLFMIPVFTVLFLYHRWQFVQVLRSMISEKYHQKLHFILHEVSHSYYKYVIGLIKVYLIVGILNSIGLMLLGVEHAILFGMLSAIMTIVPYVGIIISSLLPISVVYITTGSWLYPIGVIAVFSIVQYLESSIIFPKIVGEQMNVSTWAILVALIGGGIIWGVSGMVLFIPFVAIIKIVSGHIDEWRPINLLLSRGDESISKEKKID
ncbi:AI-2E family transporter [Flavobacteriaceae bacterium KMM 6897]|nr:AI-2E family transporter [Flavobacteriaceae bacterium KMM 6897]